PFQQFALLAFIVIMDQLHRRGRPRSPPREATASIDLTSPEGQAVPALLALIAVAAAQGDRHTHFDHKTGRFNDRHAGLTAVVTAIRDRDGQVLDRGGRPGVKPDPTALAGSIPA